MNDDPLYREDEEDEEFDPAVTRVRSRRRRRTARPRHTGRWVFFGHSGLRAGWSILVFAALCAVLITFSQAVVSSYVEFQRGVPVKPLTALLMEITQLVPAVLATCVMALFERRPVWFYGYRPQGFSWIIRLVSGLIWGFLAITALVLLLYHSGYLAYDGHTIMRSAAKRLAIDWAVVFLAVGFTEETMFRGYAQFTVTRGIGFWWGALLFAVLFGFMHHTNPGESPVGLIGAGAASLIFCLSLWFTGSLWWAVGFHAAWDWGQSFFYGTADSGLVVQEHLLNTHPMGKPIWSGGTTGPEGSILVVPILMAIGLGMFVWWGLRKMPAFAGAGLKPGRRPPEKIDHRGHRGHRETR